MSRIRIVIVLLVAATALLFMSGRARAAASCYVVSSDVGYVCDTNPPPSSFGKPVVRHDSILPKLKFGKLADNINVYAEPNMGSPIVRNAGDGFLFYTIEDTAIALGDCLYQALGSKRGIERYGYALPMDDCLCQVCLDFGGRPWLVWDAEFHREKIGEMPTEMFLHFFKSLSDAARMNLNIKAEGQNEHHKIEGIFKALARALKMAIRRDIYNFELPSSKGVL